MDSEQAQTMIDLLIEISEKLTKLSDKVAHDKDYNTVNDKLGEVVSELSSIKCNTSNL
jgi:hypothetical protein